MPGYVPPHLRKGRAQSGGGSGRSLAELAGDSGDLRGPAAALLAKQESTSDEKPDFASMFPKRQVRDWSAQGDAKYGAPSASAEEPAEDQAASARKDRAEKLGQGQQPSSGRDWSANRPGEPAGGDEAGGNSGAGGTVCFNCGEIGHKSRDCQQPKSAGASVVSAGGDLAGGGGQACFNCGEIGHISRECPQGGRGGRGGSGQTCFNCGEIGHISRECPQGGGGADGQACFNCGQIGHKSRDCPQQASAGGRGDRRQRPGAGWALGGSHGPGCLCDTEPGGEHMPVYVHARPEDEAEIARGGEQWIKEIEHTLSLDRATSEGRSLLGSHGQFCAVFYHMFPVWEAGVKDGICIDPVECVVSHAVVAVGRLELRDSQTSPWRTAYVGRYMNCYRGSEKDNYHAEQFMLEDSDLEAAIKTSPALSQPADGAGGRVSVYLTYQPCHFSGGHVKNIGKAVTTSCTMRLIEWLRTTLRPAGITLTIYLPKVYRAHWQDDGFHKTADEKKHYAERADKAREGLMLLMNEPGCDVQMMGPDDWQWLMGLCDPYVLQEYNASLAQPEDEMLAEIAEEDAKRAAEEAEKSKPRPILVMGLNHKAWIDLTEEEQTAAITLGWDTQERWDHEAMPLCTEKLWDELTKAEQQAADVLGFTGPIWDGEEDPTAPVAPEEVEAFWLGLPEAPPRVVASVVHPQWRDSSRDNPWKVHFWPNGKFWKEDPRPKHAKGRARQTIQYSGMWEGSGGVRGHDRITLHWDGWPSEHWVSGDGGVNFVGEADKGQREPQGRAGKEYIMYDFKPAIGSDPMQEAALLVAKAQEEVAAMPEEEPRIRTRARVKEGEEGQPRKLFNARSRWGRVKCDTYFAGFLDKLRAQAASMECN